MDVSFIIPARNEQATLRYTVANLYKTVTQATFEVIVVDDDSDEDQSRRLEPATGVVYLRNARRLGVARSRNVGARVAKGDVLIFLDAHVCFARGSLEALCREKELLAHGLVTPATVVVRDFEDFVALSSELRVPWRLRWRAARGGYEYYGYVMTPLPTPQTRPNFIRRSRDLFTVPIAGSAALCVKRDLFFALGGFEDELGGFGGHEDAELCMRSWTCGYWVAVVPSIRCFHYAPRRGYHVDYRRRPFHSAYYEQSVENALRVFYLHLPADAFQELLAVYGGHAGFTPDLTSVLTKALDERKRRIDTRRIHDYRWLLRRLSRV